jgi:hypothetical protein
MVTRVGADFLAQANRAVVLGVAGRTSPYRVMQDIGALLVNEPGRQGRKLGPIAYQAERIQRTEMLRAFAVADEMRTAQLAEDVPELRKWWDAVGDARTRPEHSAAERRYRPGGSVGPIKMTEDFEVGGHKASGPHDPRLPASQTVMCRCIRRVWHPDWAD